MSSELQADDSGSQQRCCSLSRKIAVGLSVGVIAIGLLHRPLLRAVYGFLTWNDESRQVSMVVLSGADRLGLDRAAEILSSGKAGTVLIVQRRLPRIAEIGIVPKPGDVIRQELVARGVSESAIDHLHTDAVTTWQWTRELDQHLKIADADLQVAMLCPQHHTRKLRWVIDRSVDPSRGDRYRVWSFSPGNFDADNWWTSRRALVKVAVGYLRLFHVIGFGEGEFDADNWSPDAYEESITARRFSRAA